MQDRIRKTRIMDSAENLIHEFRNSGFKILDRIQKNGFGSKKMDLDPKNWIASKNLDLQKNGSNPKIWIQKNGDARARLPVFSLANSSGCKAGFQFENFLPF